MTRQCWTPAAARAKSPIESRACCRDARVLGIDIIENHLEAARARCATLGERVAFENRSIFELGIPDAQFDLVVCRHVLQAVPHADRAIAELARVTKRGGWIHLIAEDYLMINFEPRRLDPDDFWIEGPRRFGSATGTNMRIGRSTYGILRRLGLSNISVDYVVVDPLRVPRETFAAIWRPGGTDMPTPSRHTHRLRARCFSRTSKT